MRLNWPELLINYSPTLEASITCVIANKYRAGYEEYFFEVMVRLKHPTGYFEYFVDHLCFEQDAFGRFAGELRNIQQGAADHAALFNVGETLAFRLNTSGRKLHLTLTIREFVPPDVSTHLSHTMDVDYDLFVNTLPIAVEEFAQSLRAVDCTPLDRP